MKKRFLVVSLLMLAICCLLLGLAACKGKVTIEGWTDSTETVELGSTYDLGADEVVASDGKTYEVTIEVLNSNGENVPVYFGQFDITDINGYTVRYTAAGLTKTVTLTVHDGNKPVIILGNSVAIGWVNDFFTFPSIKVTDDSGIAPTVNKVLTLGTGDEAQPIDFEETGFTPKSAGRYYFTVSATDGEGNTNEEQVTFYARNKPSDEVIESFDIPETVSLAYSGDGLVNFSYEEGTIGDETDALKMEIHGSAQWPWLYVKTAYESTHYADYDYYSFSIYIDPQGLPAERLAKKIEAGGATYVIKVGEWNKIAVPMDYLLQHENSSYPGYYGLFNFLNDSANNDPYRIKDDSFTVYIKDVIAIKENKPEQNVVEPLNSVTLTARLHSDSSIVSFSEEGIGGRQNVARIDMLANDQWPNVYVNSMIDLTQHKDKYIGYWLYLDGNSLDSERTGKTLEIGGRTYPIAVDKWVYISYPLADENDDIITATSSRIISWLNDDQSALRARDSKFTYYMSEITIFDRTEATSNEYNALSDKSSGYDVIITEGSEANSANIVASPTYDTNAPQGATTRVDVLVASGYPAIWVRPHGDVSADGITVSFEMYIDKASMNRPDATRKIFVVDENGTQVRKYVTLDGWMSITATLTAEHETWGDYWRLGYFMNDNASDCADTDGRIQDKTFTFYIKNVKVEISSITIENEDFTLDEGYTQQITVVESKDFKVVYTTSDEDVAVVDENGLVTAIGEGKATITASIGGVSDTVNVTVTPRAEANSNEVESLNTPAALKNLMSDNANWSMSFSENGIGDREKVIKVAETTPDAYVAFYVKPRVDLSEFDENSYISFYIYIDSATISEGRTAKQIQVGYSEGTLFPIVAGKWVRVTQPLSNFVENSSAPGYYRLFKLHNKAEGSFEQDPFSQHDAAMVFYLSEITIHERTLTGINNEIAALNDGSLNDIMLFTATNSVTTQASMQFVTNDVTGESGAVYITLLSQNNDPAIYVRPRDKTVLENAEGVAFDIYIAPSSVSGNAVQWIEDSNGSRYMPVKVGVWTSLVVPIDAFKQHTVSDSTFGFSEFYSLGYFGNDGIGGRPQNTNMAFYIKNVRAIQSKTPEEGKLTAFDEMSVFDDISFGDADCFAVSYDVNGIASKSGVIRFDQIKDVGAPVFSVNTAVDLTEYNYISFYIYIEPDSLDDSHNGKILLAGDTGSSWINPYTGDQQKTAVPAGQWIRLVFEKQYFINSADKTYSLFTFMNGGGEWTKDTGTVFYITDIEGHAEKPQ